MLLAAAFLARRQTAEAEVQDRVRTLAPLRFRHMRQMMCTATHAPPQHVSQGTGKSQVAQLGNLTTLKDESGSCGRLTSVVEHACSAK